VDVVVEVGVVVLGFEVATGSSTPGEVVVGDVVDGGVMGDGEVGVAWVSGCGVWL
jgi:hypothetical protein